MANRSNSRLNYASNKADHEQIIEYMYTLLGFCVTNIKFTPFPTIEPISCHNM